MNKALVEKISQLSPDQLDAIMKKLRLRQENNELQSIPRRKNRAHHVRLSPQQKRLWTLSKFNPGSPEYNIPGVFRLKSAIKGDVMQNALEQLMNRHDILRTVFAEQDDDACYQVVRTDMDLPFFQRELYGVDESTAQPEAIREVINAPFDMHNGPLWRAVLMRVDADEAILALSMHHIIFDGWSLGVFVRELFEYYTKLLRGAKCASGSLAIQYTDYSEWSNAHLAKVFDASARYWKDALKDAPHYLILPADGARTSHEGSKGAIHTLTLDYALFDQIKDFARRNGATPFNFFHSVLNVLLYRYCGVTDLIIGAPVSGRDMQQTHPMIGLFVNTLPVRAVFSSEDSFTQVLRKTREGAVSAFEYGELPFDVIVETVNPERITGCNPLFQVLYTYQNKIPAIETDALSVEYETVDMQTSKFDLSLDVFESFDGVSCIFEYDTAMFRKERIVNMATHFANLVRQVLKSLHTPIRDLDYLRPEEKRLALDSVTRRKHLPGPQTFGELFDQIVKQHADASCVLFEDKVLSYAQVAQLSQRYQMNLKSQGVGRQSVVAVCLERSEQVIPLLVAVLNLGASFVMLDPAHPAERLKFIVKDCAAALVVGDAKTASVFAQSEVAVCRANVLATSQNLSSPVKGAVSTAISTGMAAAEDVAYIVYTSGTTGQPKGVSNSHRSWLNALHGWVEAYGLGTDVNNHLQMASPGFDVFCGDFIRALGTGGALTICPQHLLAAPEALHRLMTQNAIECAEFVPAVFRGLAIWLTDTNKTLDRIKVLIVASDLWYFDEYRAYQRLCAKGARIINSYGMAEACIDSTWFELDAGHTDYNAKAPVPIGKPFANVEVLILDAQLNLLPPGIPGEICIGGYGVSNGYLGRPELTAQRFVDHPYSDAPDAKLYRSGDIGVMQQNGVIHLLGRNDFQVKIRGQRIELAEIEAAMISFAQIEDAVACVFERAKNDKQLVAYYVASDQNGIDENGLRRHLQDRVPGYMIPTSFIGLPTLPLSANGKVDRKKLPQPVQSRRDMTSTFVSPSTLNQEMLAGIWCQVLELPRVGVHNSFFELGGHSLMAFKIIAHIKKVFNVDLSIHTLFSNPTIAELEKHIIARQDNADQSREQTEEKLPMVRPEPEKRYAPFPLTEVQQAYWIGRNELFEFGNVTTHSYDELETVDLDIERFEHAWNKVIERHDMLKCVIRRDGTQQVLKKTPYYKLPFVDLTRADETQIDEQIDLIRGEMSHQKLDVHHWPVFDLRATLLPEGKARLHFSTDALIWDAWSFVILIEDLVRFYIDTNEPLQPLELSFRDYVLAENKLCAGEHYQKSLAYWRDRVKDLPPAPQLPMAMNPNQVKRPRFTRLHQKMAPDTWDRLKLKATRAGMTATGITLAAYAEVLMLYAQDPRFSLNLTFLNRHPLHPQVNDIVGEFTSLTLLSVDNSAQTTLTQRARKIQSDLWHDIEHHYISGVQVLRDLTRETGGATRAKMPVVFTSALVVPIPKRNPKFPITPVYRDGVTQTSQVWLDCGVWEDDRHLLCNWDVVLELYPDGMAEEMFKTYWRLLNRLADEEAIWEQQILDILPARHGLNTLGESTAYQPCEQTLVSLFLERAARSPENIAVIDHEGELSYDGLLQRVTGLQQRLLQNGTDREELVAVFLEKGWRQAVATLAIMSAGAAYVPIDPGLPEARIRFLLEHCNVRKIVTQPELAQRAASYGEFAVHTLTSRRVCATDRLATHCLPEPGDLAYVIFTSGSTGMPKGVMIEHGAAANTVIDINTRYGVTALDRVLSVSALNFDLSVYDLFGLFQVGGSVVFPEPERRQDPIHWFELLQRHKITLWNSVPALAGLLADYAQTRNSAINDMRCIMMSGDWIPLNLPGRLKDQFPDAQIHSLGGATEASIWSIAYPIETVDPGWSSIPYGKPLARQCLYVLDHLLDPCPIWVPGELYIGGIGLARGYWQDAQKTSAAFFDHPVTGERLYKTGDLGRMLPDGNLEILGRTDFQVKVQGHRIELGEIEVTLTNIPEIKEAVVVACGEKKGDKRLVGYIVPANCKRLDSDSIRSRLRAKLPEYMVPATIIELDHLPLSANGKVKRSALPQIGTTRSVQRVAPASEWENKLFKLWSGLIGHDDFGVKDDFFQSGGDSMLAIRMLTGLNVDQAAQLSLRQIFLNPTIEKQAMLIEAGQAERPDSVTESNTAMAETL